MAQSLVVLGVDIGTTTCHCVLARLAIEHDGVKFSKNILGAMEILYESSISFTPFHGDQVNVEALGERVLEWLSHCSLPIHCAGAIVTGLASRSHNRHKVDSLLKELLPKPMVVATEDPRLESWVSWQGSCGAYSKALPESYFINIDIGGGTSNIAIGKAGKVLATGSYFIGARHFVLKNGKWTRASEFAGKIPEVSGGLEEQAHQIAKAYAELLEAILVGNEDPRLEGLIQAPYSSRMVEAFVCFSGGVGELVYRKASKGLFEFNDLGPALAHALRQSKFFASRMRHQPHFKTRATVVGIGIHNARLSGSSIWLSPETPLPLLHIPILAAYSFQELMDPNLRTLETSGLSAVQLKGSPTNYDHLRQAALGIHKSLGNGIILLEKNYGKVLGSVLHQMGLTGVVALDEVEPVPAHFVSLGCPLENTVPISYYGFY